MMQADLFDAPPRARTSDPWTSHAAAEQAPSLAQVHFAVIRAALKRGPATIYDLASRTGLSHVQIARRLPEMDDAVPTNETAPSPSGRACRLWKLA